MTQNETELRARDIPRTWVYTTLNEVATIITGNTPPTNDKGNYGGRIPFVKPTQLQNGPVENPDETLTEQGAKFSRIVPANSVMVSCIGNLGRTGFVQENSAFNQQINAVVFGPAVEPKYGFYACQCLRTYLELVASATTIPIVNKSKFSDAPIPIAPLSEQARIVAEIERLFSLLDAGVANLNRVQANLKRYRASVLRAACTGKLVPTEAELARAEGRDYEPANRLLLRILAERRARWEADQLAKMRAAGKEPPRDDRWRDRYEEPAPPDAHSLPKVSEGWVWATLRSIGSLAGGVTKGQKRDGGVAVRDVPYLRVANVQRGYLDLTEVKTIAASEAEIAELRLVRGDILFNEGGDRDKLGRGWVWQEQIKECVHQNHVFRARLYTADVSPKYISWYGNSVGAAYFVEQGKQTTNLASINMTKLGSLPIPLPPAAEQERIVAEVERRLSVVDALEATVAANLKRAERLRQSILRDAFAGRLVPQDPSDEPASALLKRIREERAAGGGAAATAPRTRRTPKTKEQNTDGRNKQDDAPGKAVSPGVPGRVRGAGEGTWVQPDLFSPDGS